MRITEILKSKKYIKIFLKFPINSILSFVVRFFSLYFLVDILNYSYTVVYCSTYLYVVFQSYLVQKYLIQKSSANNFLKFLITNLILGFFEFSIIYVLQLQFNSYYSYLLIFAASIIYFIRFYIYTFKIFKN